ncbi:hypothetical protein NG799_20590 [Laspinema sp. D1]|uniref:site-specific DNA-methyltransferase (adenine-specific) n=1 Tax=Laspinema palackyanum D2a TaxID=2953684 RepID=A0ABT2MVE6_9CYAN|nr:hypothetical protein [Laspinema sp. D2a]
MTIDFQKARPLLQEFQFSDLFVQQLGWSYPSADKSVRMEVEGEVYSRSPVAELSGVGVFEVSAADGEIPNATARMAIYKEIAELVRENLLIFVGKNRTQCVWYWVKRDGTKLYPRDHVYVKREPCDLLLSKISALYVSLDELESLTVIEVAQRLQAGLDVERITKKFFEDFKQQHLEFLSAIRGIDKEGDRRWYTSVLLNRLMFVYFLQRKGFIDGGKALYLQEKLEESKDRGTDLFYREFLPALFFDGFAKPLDQRSPAVMALIGDIKYLNGGLFLTHQIEQNYPDIAIPDEAFEKVFALFAGYSWNLDDTLEGKENEINPAVLGYIFEKYINQKAFGAYYTRSEITEYLCDKTINKLILDRINQANAPRQFETITELLTKLDAKLCRQLLEEILPTLSLLDPACGSGAFLVAAMKTLIYIYSNVIATVKVRITDHYLNNWLTQVETEHPSLNYYIKKRIITDNLYGVDIMEEATEIAKLRLFLALVSSAHNVSELEPLPNIDFNIMAGNSLIGLIRVDETGFDAINSGTKGKGKKKDSEPVALQGNLLQPLVASAYQKILTDKNESIDLYKKHAFQPGEQEGTSQESRLLMLRRHIEQLNKQSQDKLNHLLWDEFSSSLGIKYQEVQLSGKPKKRLLKIDDIAALKPFHWGYHFDVILERGGFDAILTNPPWEIFKPNGKEFFTQYSNLITKKKMDIHSFNKEQKKLLQDPEISDAWLEYQSQFPHVSAYYRAAEQYKNQISIVNDKKVGTDINLYKLFLEKCFNLLRPGGECGLVIPSGIYTDLGAKKLRQLLFNQNRITGLFCFENRSLIFEGVDSRFKFVVLTFEKGGETQKFPAKFMRHDIHELQNFPDENSQIISIDLVKKLSPDSFSIMELKNTIDLHIMEKMLTFPLLGENMAQKWNLRLNREFDMTNHSYLFKQQPAKGQLPLYEGKMIHQFTHLYAEPRYWVEEEEGREALLGKKGTDIGQKLDYQCYRFAYRAIARSTDSRTLIGTVLPSKVFCGNSLNIASPTQENKYMLFICAALNSFCVDFALRQQVSANINMFYSGSRTHEVQ